MVESLAKAWQNKLKNLVPFQTLKKDGNVNFDNMCLCLTREAIRHVYGMVRFLLLRSSPHCVMVWVLSHSTIAQLMYE